MFFSGSRGRGSRWKDEGGAALPWRPFIDAVGAGITASDDAANGKTVITIPGATGGGGLPDGVFTPAMYGGLGDGSHDDTAALQAAFDAARAYKTTYGQGTVLITPGIWRITGPIDVNGASNDHFTGMALMGMGGFWNCVIKFDPPNFAGYSSTNPLTMLNWSHNNSNYEGWNRISDIWFQGPGSGSTWGAKPARCLNLTDESDWSTWPQGAGGPAYIDKGGHYFTTVSGCRFDNWQYAITGFGTLVNRFYNLLIENVWKGFYLEGRSQSYNPGANANIFRDCRYVGCTEGAYAYGGAGNFAHIVGSGSYIDGGNFEFFQTAPGTGIGSLGGTGYQGAVVLENGGEGGVTKIGNIWFESGLAPIGINIVSAADPTIISHNRYVFGETIKIGNGVTMPVVITECHGGGLAASSATAPVRVQRCKSFTTAGTGLPNLVVTDAF